MDQEPIIDPIELQKTYERSGRIGILVKYGCSEEQRIERLIEYGAYRLIECLEEMDRKNR